MWDTSSGEQCGELLSYDPSKEAADLPVFPPHERAVQALAIDQKSRYLFSGDALGAVLMWRQDAQGWYQIMRRLKKDDIAGLAIHSLSIYTTPGMSALHLRTSSFAILIYVLLLS